MKKRVLATLLAVGVVLSLAGCKPSEVTSTTESNKTTEYVEETETTEEVVTEVTEETETTEEVTEVVEEVTEETFVPMYDPATFDAVAFFEEVKAAHDTVKYVKLNWENDNKDCGYRYFNVEKQLLVQEQTDGDMAWYDLINDIAVTDNEDTDGDGNYGGWAITTDEGFMNVVNNDVPLVCPKLRMNGYVDKSTLVEETEATVTTYYAGTSDEFTDVEEYYTYEEYYTFDKETNLLIKYTLSASDGFTMLLEYEYPTEGTEGFEEFISKFELPEFEDMR